jgi:XTP/dITP diphosphohydrolase
MKEKELSTQTGSRKSIVFATTSRWKIDQAKDFLKPYGIDVQFPPEFHLPEGQLYVSTAGGSDQYTIEIQAESIEEVSEFKTSMAARNLNVPLIAEDIGVSIDTLDGFPGPYTKYAVVKLGIPGFQRLMNGVKARGARMTSVVGYCEPGGKPHLFAGEMIGTLAPEPRAAEDNPWKDVLLYRLFIPDGETRTLAEIYPDELKTLPTFPSKTSFGAFGAWFSGESR